MNFNRVWGVVLRHLFLARRQLERLSDLFMFPVVGILLWGFLSKVSTLNTPSFAAFLLGGLILWVVFERVGTGIGVDFMYEVWDRNIVNILASPITIAEFIAGLVLVALVKVLISFAVMWAIAAVFFGFNVGSLGMFLVLFWLNIIIFAASLGIFNIAIVIRYGGTIGPLTWILPFLLQPFVAVFYPVSVLPVFVQKIAWFIPLSHVFEGMRYTLATGKFETGQFTAAIVLNLIYFALLVAFFTYMFNLVKKKGTLVKL